MAVTVGVGAGVGVVVLVGRGVAIDVGPTASSTVGEPPRQVSSML
jgi:hypothetical protein